MKENREDQHDRLSEMFLKRGSTVRELLLERGGTLVSDSGDLHAWAVKMPHSFVQRPSALKRWIARLKHWLSPQRLLPFVSMTPPHSGFYAITYALMNDHVTLLTVYKEVNSDGSEILPQVIFAPDKREK